MKGPTKSERLDDIQRDTTSSSVWVLNRTNPAGVLNIEVPNGLGGTMTLVIPRSWVPMDVTTQVTKEAVLSNPQFRRLVSMGLIWLVKNDDALAMLAGEDAKEESLRLYSYVSEDSSLTASPELAKAKAESGVDEGVSGFAINFVTMTDLEESEALNLVRGNDGILKAKDYEYIMANSHFSKVKDFCASCLTE